MAGPQHLVGELHHRAHQGDAALVEERHPVANALHPIEQMGGQQHRHAHPLQPADHLQELESGMRVEARGRLVEDGDLGLLHHDLGDAQTLAHAARVGRNPSVDHVGQLHALHRLHDAPADLRSRNSEQACRVGQILPRRQVIVEAHRIRQVTDPALDLEGLAHRVEAQHLDRAAADLRQPQHHQDGRRLAGAIGAEQAEDLAAANIEVDGVDGALRAVEFQQPARLDDVAAAGAERGDIVAGNRLVARRHQDLHFLLFVGRHAGDGLGIELDLPVGRNGARHLDFLDRRGAVVAHDQRVGGGFADFGLAGQAAVLGRECQLALAADLQRDPELGRGALGRDLDQHRVVARLHIARRRHLDLDVLGLAGLDRNRADLVGAEAFGEGGLEIGRTLRRQRHREILAAVVADRDRIFEGRARRAAQRRQARLQAELGRRLGADGQRENQIGRLGERALGAQHHLLRAGLGVLRHVDAELQADVLVDARHGRGDGLAAAQDVDLPTGRHVGERERHRLGRQAGIGELHADGGDLAGTHRLRGIVGDEEQAPNGR